MRGAFALAVAGAALYAAPAFAAPVHKRPVHPGAVHHAGPAAARDWSRTVLATPAGGFRMGNPAARVKVIEYGSLTCPHCRHFAQTGAGPLVQRYVRSGKVSYEFRNLILNGVDVAASLLARCTGANFFRAADAMYATQPVWVGKALTLPEAEQGKPLVVGAVSGLIPLTARFGLTPVRARACLADKAGLTRLGAMAEAANKLGVNSTPTFFVNGARADAATWEELEPLIRKAGG